jgi:predicted nuclease of predicted toxin-antitoxin system
MRFLANESCDAAVVRALRETGHDVTSVRDTMRGATDRMVLHAAVSERRLLLTEDKDFGTRVRRLSG